MGEEKRVCALCGLPVQVSGFELKTQQGIKYFCCEGCQGIYQMLHQQELEPNTPDNDK